MEIYEIKKFTMVCPRSFEGVLKTNQLLEAGWFVCGIEGHNILMATTDSNLSDNPSDYQMNKKAGTRYD
ncbi:hypothetical protein ACI1TZ_04870 [Lactococcus formosensis subsp. formosensis]|uniref:hypothetical protein n=1 Tax=Lactococcus formosensis TaxID=1281486 RepID=UPI003851F548